MIREATINDIPAIKLLMQSEPGFWQDGWRKDVLTRAISSADSLAFVWEEDSQIYGFACAHDCAFRGYLSELIVHQSKRGHGIGKAIMQTVQQELHQRGCAILIADVWKDAEEFYTSLGWTEPVARLLRKVLG